MLEIIIGLLLLVLYLSTKLRKLKLPGPSPLLSLPLVGHGYLLGKNPIKSLLKYKKTYGNIFRLDVGSIPTVFLCDWRLIVEGTKSELMAGRPYNSMPTFHHIRRQDSKGNLDGLITTQGRSWQEQRKFMLGQLNDLGMGSNDFMEGIISEEAEHLAQRMVKLTNQKLQITRYFHTTVNNVIWRLITGKRTRQDDPELIALTEKTTEVGRCLYPGSLLNLLQLESLTVLKLSSAMGISNIMDAVKPLYAMIENEMKGKREDSKGDFIERCLAEVSKNKMNEQSVFNGKDGSIHILGEMLDFILAGTDTVSTFLEWSILYLCQYPDIQEQVHQNIKDCFGMDSSISLKDSFRLPFVEATIEEVWRSCPETVLTLPHSTIGDMSIGGYMLPKGTQVFSFITSVHMDSKIFEKPEEFNPSRFIDSNGNFQRDERVLFFGHGKRRCLGERLARAECFLFFATLFQKFKFSKVGELSLEPICGAIFYPKPFDLLIELRK